MGPLQLHVKTWQSLDHHQTSNHHPARRESAALRYEVAGHGCPRSWLGETAILNLGIESRMPFGIVGLHVYTFVLVLVNLLFLLSRLDFTGVVSSGLEWRPSRAGSSGRRPKCLICSA